MAAFPPSTPAFFVIANEVKPSKEPFSNRNNKKELRSSRAARFCVKKEIGYQKDPSTTNQQLSTK